VARLRVMVQNQLGDRHLGVRGLARQSGCTADHLSSVFSRSTGEHLAAYINRLRLARAAHLLRDTAMAAKEVAWACGYASPSYFSHCFRRQHGVSPQQWRGASGATPHGGAPSAGTQRMTDP
jgi:transcriptional regulator GlxA family with amidase domain